MRKVFVKGYFYQNLGDDLFLNILCKRYSDTFIVFSNEKKYLKNKNLNWIHNNIYRKAINKLTSILLKKNFLLNKLIKKCDFSIIIGGSLFIEKNFSDFELYKMINDNNKDYYIIGSNVGPYTSDEFINKLDLNIFKKSKYVCFRDKKSLKLFEGANLNSASDIVFSYDFSKYIQKNEKKVFISVIDCMGRFDENTSNMYDQYIINTINYFSSLKYKIVLASFCKKENDMIAIDRILKKIDNPANIKVLDYKGNIDEALFEMGNSEYIIGSRFHACVIGLAMQKKVLPIAYSIKTINMLKDIKFNGKYIDMKNNFIFEKSTFKNIKALNNQIIRECKKDSLNHFKELDKVLQLRGEDDV